MPFDPKKYIDSLDLDAAQKATLEAVFAKEKNVAEMTRGYAARDEASRLMDEGTKAKTAAEAAVLAAAAEKAEADRIKLEADTAIAANRSWAEALKKYEPDFIQTKAERDALVQEKADYEAYLTSIGVEPSYALGGRQPAKPVIQPPAAKEPPPVNQPPATITEEEMQRLGLVTAKQVQPAIGLLSNLPFELNKVQFKHARLFGKALPDTEMDAIQDAYLDPKNTRSLSEIAAEKLHFGEREAELETERINRMVEERSQELYTKRMSELNLPGAAVDNMQPNLESVVHFASKDFSEKPGSSSASMAGVSAEEMQMFLQADKELAAQGIRPTPFG